MSLMTVPNLYPWHHVAADPGLICQHHSLTPFCKLAGSFGRFKKVQNRANVQ